MYIIELNKILDYLNTSFKLTYFIKDINNVTLSLKNVN